MEATEARLAVYREAAVARWQARQQLVQELSTLSAHLNAATARWLELALEAREYLRVGEALQELPALRAAFGRGELSFCKLRALTRVATPVCEQRCSSRRGR